MVFHVRLTQAQFQDLFSVLVDGMSGGPAGDRKRRRIEARGTAALSAASSATPRGVLGVACGSDAPVSAAPSATPGGVLGVARGSGAPNARRMRLPEPMRLAYEAEVGRDRSRHETELRHLAERLRGHALEATEKGVLE